MRKRGIDGEEERDERRKEEKNRRREEYSIRYNIICII